MLKQTLPLPVKRAGRRLIKYVRYNARRALIVYPVLHRRPMKVILGAAETWQAGWYATNECWLDITRSDHWHRVFKGRKLITHVLAEHVMEHLSEKEMMTALGHIADNISEKGGRIRIAVPDGYHPDPVYLRHVEINGIGDDALDHRQLLNVDTLSAHLREAGFEPVHLEGYTRDGVLVQKPYDTAEGFVRRSRANPKRKNNPWKFPDADTSLIVDGIKR